MGFYRDFTISYVAGVVGALVIVFSTEGVNLQPNVFWLYFPLLYFIVIGIYIGFKAWIRLK